FTYRWIIKRENDSVTRVTALIKDEKNSLLQKLQVPFYKNAFLKRNIATVKKVRDKLKENTKYYKVAPVEKDSIPAVYCAYIPLSCRLWEKANTMIGNIHIITDYIKDNAITLAGDPFLEITGWDLQEDTITFNFCFPVEERDGYPENGIVKFRKTKARAALKTRFNGNYKISDSAWYTLIDYAQTNAIPIEKLPFEVYLNDPHAGGNELEWQAEVYMPLKN
ncbi:MAG: GyrI-like domain-containing protein, partial [Sinomicrobium sp.]|nr:GyrI-like domain-containing protein [Sinomicrobium sp.]